MTTSSDVRGGHAEKPVALEQGRRRMILAVVIVLAVYAAAVALASLELRARWREQALLREGEVLDAVARMQGTVVAEHADIVPLADDGGALEVALHTSRLRGVLAVRLFDAGGTFRDAVPATVDEGRLATDDLLELSEGRPVVRLHPDFPLDALFLTAGESRRVSLLEVTSPLALDTPAGRETTMIQYWIDGSIVAQEFARIDRHVGVQALVAFAAGSVLILGSLVWAFRRLTRANTLLHERAHDLARANRELAQTARTAALGAVTAHLMHGVRSPFAGLEGLVAARAGEQAAGGGEWQSALESTRRIRSLLDEVQALLGDLASGAEFEVTAAELCAGLCERLGPVGVRRHVALEVRVPEGGPTLGAREAGLGGLVLANLVQNAIEASPEAGTVVVDVRPAPERALDFRVIDHGAGLPAEVAAEPFRPRRSTKPDGAGIGLAISQELARHAGGRIELVRTGTFGTEFRVVLPGPVHRPSRSIS